MLACIRIVFANVFIAIGITDYPYSRVIRNPIRSLPPTLIGWRHLSAVSRRISLLPVRRALFSILVVPSCFPHLFFASFSIGFSFLSLFSFMQLSFLFA